MKIGISLACFYPEHPENTVERVSKLGFDTAELFINTFSELNEEYIHSFKELCDKNGLKIYSIHPFTSAIESYLFFSPYDRRLEDAKILYGMYCETAQILGAKVINLHGDKNVGISDFDKYVKCLDPLLELSAKYGVYLSHENVFYNSINKPDFVYKLRRTCDNEFLKFTFDIKQAKRGGSDPFEVCQSMGKDIINFHINDYDNEHMCMLPGKGVVDHELFMNQMNKNGYSGPALIEVYSSNFKSDDEILASKSYLEKINEKIQQN